MLLVLALFVGVALYGVLLTLFPTDYHPNDVAGKAFFGKCWRWLFGPGLVLGYLLFIVGACLFFNASHLAVEMMYPRYSALPADFSSGVHVARWIRTRGKFSTRVSMPPPAPSTTPSCNPVGCRLSTCRRLLA